MGKSCSKIILLILILAAWIVVTVRAKKTEEGIILTDAYKKQIMESAEWKKIFLHTENYPDILLEDLKRNPEMLEFVEGYNDVHKKSSEGLTFEERKKKVPLFIQWDKRWGYEPYGTSDIGISGCGPTCMAMVIYSLTRNTEATPLVLAQKSMNEGYYVDGIGTSWKFMREAALDYGVIASQFDMLGEQEMADRLKDGNLIICAMGPGDFYKFAIEDERMKMDNHILVVEDDAAIREGVRILLEGEGYIVQEAEDGYQCLKKVSDDIDLVILDIMMPGISGIKTCEEIRKISHVPVLFLTAKSQESDKLLGLMAGGDDYLVKPFSYAELLARVKALLRRYHVYSQTLQGEKTKEHWIEYGKVKVNTQCNEVFRNEKEISLREMEYRILLLMMENPKKVFSVKNLYESLWEEPFLYSSGNTVMVHIRRLRMKIEDDPQKPKMIQTVWGKGYRLG